MELINYLDSSFNYKKLRKSRKKRNLSISEVAEKTGIPSATLQKYEAGIIKKIPLETLKKICNLYGTDYECYYGLTNFLLFKNLSGILISLFYEIPIPIYTKLILGDIFEKLEVSEKENLKNFIEFSQNKYIKDVLYKSLTKEEQEKYEDFLVISKTVLKTNEIFNLIDEEKQDVEKLLFIIFLFHKIRKKNKEKIINFEELEKIN